MQYRLLALPALAAAAAVPSPFELAERQSCPNIHVFGARETTAPPGYGSSSTVVNLVLQAYPGSTAEAISYPACGGQSSCGGVSYANSANQGTSTVASVVNAYNQQCPNTQIVLVGYSQGGQIIDNAVCGGGDPGAGISSTAVPLTSAAQAAVKAVILMGDPRYEYGFSYEVGTCRAGGFDARPASFSCPVGSKIQSYCDSADPYCCNGNDASVHQGYGSEYGQQALAFIKSKLSSSGGTTTTTTAKTTTTNGGGSQPTSTTSTGGSGGSTGGSPQWGQCGGIGWTGPTTCQSPYTCHYSNAYYSQCY